MKFKNFKKKFLSLSLTLTLASTFLPNFAPVTYAENGNVSNISNYVASDWNQVTFGQTTDTGYNSISVDDANKSVTLTAGTADGKHTGGKITGSHDGISYYYTTVDPSKNFVLSANVKVNFFAKPKFDKQEGFGIMARDAIGPDKNADAFPSNMVLVGGYSGLIQSVFRNNIVDATGAGATMEDVTKFGDRPVNDGTATYKLTMKKTNTGYQVSVDDGKEKIYYRPKQLEIRDKDHVYVGFFVARVASITVSDINFTTSDVATDPPGEPEPPKPVAPSIIMTSATTTGDSSYNFNLLSNVNGDIKIKQNGTELYKGALDNNAITKNTTLVSGDNTFDVVFTPDKTQNITSADPITSKYVVSLKSYGTSNESIYASPTGTADGKGTLDSPTDIYSAIQYVGTGQKIYLIGGTYDLKAPINISKSNSGTYDTPKVLTAYNQEKPVLNFSSSGGFVAGGDYWNISNIDVTNTVATGFKVSGNHNVIYKLNAYKNGDTGIQISGNANDKIDKWPSYNLLLDCTSHDNIDASQNNADGFAAKLTCGVGNVLRGCIAYSNCDDGYDLYSKLETGPIGAVTIENSIAYGNGVLSDGTRTLGDGNGFKMGGEGLPVKHVLRNSLAFNNFSDGITSNSDPAVTFENCTSFNNGKVNFNLQYFNSAIPQFTANNNLSFKTTAALADNIPDTNLNDSNYFYNGTDSQNKSGEKLLASDFKSLEAPKLIERNADGSIIQGNFMMLADNSSILGGADLSDFSNITAVPGTPGIPDSAAPRAPFVYNQANGICDIPVHNAKLAPSIVKFNNGNFIVTIINSIFADAKTGVKLQKAAPTVSEATLKSSIPNTLKLILDIFDLNLYINGSEVHALAEPITYTIKVDAKALNNVDTKNLALYSFNKDTNKWEFVSDAVYDNKLSEITVKTPHLSTFAIMEKVSQNTVVTNTDPTDNNNDNTNTNTNTNNDNTSTTNTAQLLPQTGSSIDTNVLIGLGMIISALGVITLISLKNRKENA